MSQPNEQPHTGHVRTTMPQQDAQGVIDFIFNRFLPPDQPRVRAVPVETIDGVPILDSDSESESGPAPEPVTPTGLLDLLLGEYIHILEYNDEDNRSEFAKMHWHDEDPNVYLFVHRPGQKPTLEGCGPGWIRFLEYPKAAWLESLDNLDYRKTGGEGNFWTEDVPRYWLIISGKHERLYKRIFDHHNLAIEMANCKCNCHGKV